MLLASNRFDAQPLVSVCIICYRHEFYISDLFNSLLNQTYRNLEIIFVDDCSTDDSWSVAKAYEARLNESFSRVIMIRHEINKGMHLAGETAAQQVTGEYVCNMDADDYYHPMRFGYCVSFLNLNRQNGAVHSDFYREKDGVISEKGFFQETGLTPLSGWVFEKLLEENTFGHLTVMVRVEYYKKAFRRVLYQERGYMMSDYPSLLTLSKLTSFGYIPENLAYYRILEKSASHAQERIAAFSRSVDSIRQDARLGML